MSKGLLPMTAPDRNVEGVRAIDCRVLQGDRAVIISHETAIRALEAMVAYYTPERTSGMYTDDLSFLHASIRELRQAAKLEGARDGDE